jgi:hypothetical protein
VRQVLRGALADSKIPFGGAYDHMAKKNVEAVEDGEQGATAARSRLAIRHVSGDMEADRATLDDKPSTLQKPSSTRSRPTDSKSSLVS